MTMTMTMTMTTAMTMTMTMTMTMVRDRWKDRRRMPQAGMTMARWSISGTSWSAECE